MTEPDIRLDPVSLFRQPSNKELLIMRRFLTPLGCATGLGLCTVLLLGAAAKPEGIPAWEYRVLASGDFLQVDGKPGPGTNEFLAERLKQQGEQGWEFAGVVALDTWVFKRPVLE